MEYVPLHVHSDASLDGAGTVDSLVKEASRLGFKALGLTDHGTLANAVSFWSSCTDYGIKPILGIEAYLLYEGERHHITLLSLSEDGFNNLVALDSWSHKDMFVSGYPLITMSMLERYHKDLHVLTGCASSAIYRGSLDDGCKYVSDLTSIFGKFGVSLEMMFIGAHDTYTRPKEVQDRTGMFHVFTNDTHYPCRNQYPAHQAICKARRGFTYDSEHLWLKNSDELLFEARKKIGDERYLSAGMDRSMVIADWVTPWDMKAPPSLPHTPGVQELLEEKLRVALKKDVALKGQQKLRLERLRYEFRTLITKGFLDYIHILLDIVDWAKANGIAVGPGRGSGGGSYLLFLLGITRVDPVEFNLLFERFINPSRSDYPDVDMDFEADRRNEVLEYAERKWGMVPIATYSTYSHKSAVHDIARTLAIPANLEEQAVEAAVDSEAFRKFATYNPAGDITYSTMVGQIRHRGKHAAGVIIPNRPIPIERTTGDKLVAAWAEGGNSKDLSKVGIVKYDILGLTALSQLKRMEQLTGDLPPDSYDDPDIFELFCQGDVAGIFQWSGSDGIRELTVNVAPRNFYDLTTCNALYRPGALDAGTAEQYPEYMRSPRLLHPRIDKHLEKTYGVLCYQEQVMAVVAEVTGGDLSQADLIRRLISKASVGDKKWEDDMQRVFANFMKYGKAQGFERPLLEELWREIYHHSRYSYNLSHATTYTMISYQMAWYKLYYRSAFIASVLQYDRPNAQTYIIDALKSGVEIVMPSVSHPSLDYLLHGNTIYIPLSDVAYVGEKGAEYIVQEVQRNGPIESYEDFGKRIPKKLVNNRAKTMLERIGAFRYLSGDPAALIDKYAEIPVRAAHENQLEILKYVVPTKEIVEKMAKLGQGADRFCGFISSIEKRTSQHGDYILVRLSPEGSFWVRGAPPKLQVGKLVAGTKTRFGSSSDFKTYRI